MFDKDERFETIYKQGALNVTKILRDKETGVHYIFHYEGYSGGLCVLLDENGKPVIEK